MDRLLEATYRVEQQHVVLPPAPVNGLLTLLLQVEARALRIVDMPIGGSLLCVARKD
jgi:hypothetical protein